MIGLRTRTSHSRGQFRQKNRTSDEANERRNNKRERPAMDVAGGN
jgi:hypothetical protein